MMSLRAELLRLSMKAWKLSKSKRRYISMVKVRSRLRLIEPIVPGPPSGTKSTAIEVDGIKAIEILVPEARTDRDVLYFHGGGYAFGTEPLVRDLRGALAQRRPPLYCTSTTDLPPSIHSPLRSAEKVRGAGGEVELEEWPRMPHGWQHYARIIPEGQRAIERIGVFVHTRLN